MIILSPTGAFSRILPQDESDSTSVTFTISNNPPPPIIASFVVKAPRGIIDGVSPVEVSSRSDFGPLIFTLVGGNKTITGSNRRAFEAGEVIEFSDATPTSDSSASPVPIVVQHNNNMLDLEDLGLTAEEIAQVSLQSASKLDEVKALIGSLQSSINNYKILIRENQKAINEAKKAIKAVEIVYGIGSGGTNGNDIYDKLNAKLDALESERTTLNTGLTTTTAELKTAQDNLLKVSQLVK